MCFSVAEIEQEAFFKIILKFDDVLKEYWFNWCSTISSIWTWSSISWSSLTYCDNYRSNFIDAICFLAFSSSFLSVVQSANCILLLTSKCEARVYICFGRSKSTSILLFSLFFLFPFICSHTKICSLSIC